MGCLPAVRYFNSIYVRFDLWLRIFRFSGAGPIDEALGCQFRGKLVPPDDQRLVGSSWTQQTLNRAPLRLSDHACLNGVLHGAGCLYSSADPLNQCSVCSQTDSKSISLKRSSYFVSLFTHPRFGTLFLPKFEMLTLSPVSVSLLKTVLFRAAFLM